MGLFSRKKSRSPPAPLSQPAGPPPVPVDTRPNAQHPPPPPQPPHSSLPPRHGHSSPPPAYYAPQTSGSGYLPPPGGQGSAASLPYQQPPPQQTSIVVNQHYYIMPAPHSHAYGKDCVATSCAMANAVVTSAVNFTNHNLPGSLCVLQEEGRPSVPGNGWANQGHQWPGPGSSVLNQICERFNDVMTSIDLEKYRGNENKLFVCQQQESDPSTSDAPADRQLLGKSKTGQAAKKNQDHQSKGVKTAVASSGISGNYFAKVDLYANSRLPLNLPPLKLYIPTWPLLCLAAQYSERVYEKAQGKEKDVHIDADSKEGTKAMVIKSVPLPHMNTIVLAIRGTASFMDWAVNLQTDTTSPIGFLDDYGNYCHAGFLSVARKMIKPVAARLRQLLGEDPGRRSYSLLITGHSAGGAVAALLYAHMLAATPEARSELGSLTGRFKRVHCVTFGTPPVSLLPLQGPGPGPAKSLFLSFVNEGDPVARADRAYVRSLLELLATPAPAIAPASAPAAAARTLASEALRKARSSPALRSKASVVSSSPSAGGGGPVPSSGPTWRVPPSTLSNAGRIVVLRAGDPRARLKGKKTVEERLNEGVVAQIATDEQLRTVIWGDPVCHLMRLYAGRLEMLAINSVTAKGC